MAFFKTLNLKSGTTVVGKGACTLGYDSFSTCVWCVSDNLSIFNDSQFPSSQANIHFAPQALHLLGIVIWTY